MSASQSARTAKDKFHAARVATTNQYEINMAEGLKRLADAVAELSETVARVERAIPR